jgi:hypothetical protein
MSKNSLYALNSASDKSELPQKPMRCENLISGEETVRVPQT